jgi:hypothetical protein
MKEQHLRKLVVKMLKPLHAVSIENGDTHPGTPDVNYADGWIELKAVDAWPVREDTPLRVPHYTNQQRVWHVRRSKVAGRVHLLITVGSEWLLFSGRVAAKVLGHTTRNQMLILCQDHWSKTPDPKELIECLLK